MSKGKLGILIVIAGPTAVGKTSLCLKLANFFKTEIISADSRQFFKEMNLGTAKPTPEERNQVTHHLVDFKSITEPYDVRTFEIDVFALLHEIFKKKKVVILTGGSGLYIDAICKGLDEIPLVDPKIRIEIISKYEANGLDFLQTEVARLDPEYYETVDRQNPQRLMRALEVCLGTGNKFSSYRLKKIIERPFHILKLGLDRDRESLYKRIDQRMDQMLADGLLDEVKSLYPYKDLNALKTVGYSELFDFIDGKYPYEEAVRLLKRNSRRYAKRQLTWFRKDDETVWFNPGNESEIIAYLTSKVKQLE